MRPNAMTKASFSVRTQTFQLCGDSSRRHGRHFCANTSSQGCDASQKITLTAPRTAQKAQKDETFTSSSQSPQKLNSVIATGNAARRRARQASESNQRPSQATRLDGRGSRPASTALRAFHRICRTLPASVIRGLGAPLLARPSPLPFAMSFCIVQYRQELDL